MRIARLGVSIVVLATVLGACGEDPPALSDREQAAWCDAMDKAMRSLAAADAGQLDPAVAEESLVQIGNLTPPPEIAAEVKLAMQGPPLVSKFSSLEDYEEANNAYYAASERVDTFVRDVCGLPTE